MAPSIDMLCRAYCCFVAGRIWIFTSTGTETDDVLSSIKIQQLEQELEYIQK